MTLRIIKFTVMEHADGKVRCVKCKGKLRAGEKAESHLGVVIFMQHAECPKIQPMQNPEKRVIQGSR